MRTNIIISIIISIIIDNIINNIVIFHIIALVIVAAAAARPCVVVAVWCAFARRPPRDTTGSVVL